LAAVARALQPIIEGTIRLAGELLPHVTESLPLSLDGLSLHHDGARGEEEVIEELINRIGFCEYRTQIEPRSGMPMSAALLSYSHAEDAEKRSWLEDWVFVIEGWQATLEDLLDLVKEHDVVSICPMRWQRARLT
jgi:hypothetical protein